MNKNILIIGKNSQLGIEMYSQKKKFNKFDIFFFDKKNLNVNNPNKLNKIINNYNIQIVINFSAYTNVEKAENDKSNTKKINVDGLRNIVKICNKNDCFLLHISSDYVFDGSKKRPYNEKDSTNPINYYGKTKLIGEKIIQQKSSRYIIIRTSWLYSKFKSNTLLAFINLLKNHKPITVVNDQFGGLTSSYDLIKTIAIVLKYSKNLDNVFTNSIYHFSNNGVVSWYQIVIYLKKRLNSKSLIIPIKSKNYLSKVKRPKYSKLNSIKIKKKFKIDIIHYKLSVDRLLKEFI